MYNIDMMNRKTFNHKPVTIEKSEEVRTEYDNRGRRYVLPNGDCFYSVTTVTGFKKNQFFKEWRMNNPEESKRVLRRGNSLHTAIEKYIDNDETFLEGVLPNEYILFEQALTELNNIDNVLAQEIPLWSSTLGLAGRVDCVAEYNGELSIIDFKGSTRSKCREDIDNYFMQATAYAIMFKERTGIQIDNIVILMSCEDGEVQVFESSPIKHTKALFDIIQEYNAELVA